jgi:hypothetical protein
LKRVLIVSTSFDEQNMLESVMKFHDPGSFAVDTTASFGQEESFWLEEAPDLLVVKLPDEELMEQYFHAKLQKDVPKSQPILFLSRNISSSLMQLSLTFQKIRLLKIPTDAMTLFKTIQDALRPFQKGKQQAHPRFMTDHNTELEIRPSGDKIAATMKNLSLSGAYFEADLPENSLKKSDILKVKIEIGDPKKFYFFDAKIIWIKLQRSPNTFGFGVNFIDTDESIDSILKNLEGS